jgi:type IV pilus assembly protein PilC
LQALEIAGGTVGNSYIEAQFPRVLEQVRSGVSLSRALQRVDGFRYKLISAIAVGEESGQLDRMLRGTADTMDFDAQQASKRMLTILEPALVVVMAVLVGCIMLGVMLPMVQSYGIIEGRTYY